MNILYCYFSGLSYILEVKESGNVVHYKCLLCYRQFKEDSLISHLISIPHMKKYARLHLQSDFKEYENINSKSNAEELKTFLLNLTNNIKENGQGRFASCMISKESKIEEYVKSLSVKEIEEMTIKVRDNLKKSKNNQICIRNLICSSSIPEIMETFSSFGDIVSIYIMDEPYVVIEYSDENEAIIATEWYNKKKIIERRFFVSRMAKLQNEPKNSILVSPLIKDYSCEKYYKVFSAVGNVMGMNFYQEENSLVIHYQDSSNAKIATTLLDGTEINDEILHVTDLENYGPSDNFLSFNGPPFYLNVSDYPHTWNTKYCLSTFEKYGKILDHQFNPEVYNLMIGYENIESCYAVMKDFDGYRVSKDFITRIAFPYKKKTTEVANEM